MARRKAKFCTSCGMKFLGNHVCTGLNKKVLYDDAIMVDIVKGVAKGPDVSKQFELNLPEPSTDDPNSRGV